ncbi:transmembrane anchored protein [Klebsiella pneumoniae]|uniref:transmembrane anchored protein n=1 Tax=Klebsiella pneumoniae TaxID=573 RepID=UPI001162CB6E|nr:transmembrane anchored protein [Klebsiella pneumoniae]QDP08102.1 transmembrane anchored protein [Klebsiella pneumoniae]
MPVNTVLAARLLLLSLGSVTQAYAGNCQHPDDTAADGSRCGGRSADSRPGGQ